MTASTSPHGASLPVTSRRSSIARALTVTGGTRLLEMLPSRRAIVILNFHRVGEAADCQYDRGVFEATAEEFVRQMDWVKSNFRVACLEQVQEWIECPHRLPRGPHALITFDDGYRDLQDVAFPLLRSRGIPAACFLPTSFIETDRVPWWDQIAFLLRQTDRRTLDLEYPRHVEIDLVDREKAIQAVLRLYSSPGTRNVARFLTELERAAGGSLQSTSPSPLFIDWTQARSMMHAGISFGSHTHHHEILANLSPAEQFEELRISMSVLRRELRTAPESLAYPTGRADSFSANTKAAAKAAGYRTAFSYYGGANLYPAFDPYDVRRLSAELDSGFHLFRLRTVMAAKVDWAFL